MEQATCAMKAETVLSPASTGSEDTTVDLNGPVKGGIVYGIQSTGNGSALDALLSIGLFAANGSQGGIGIARDNGGPSNLTTNVYHDDDAAIIGIEEGPGLADPATLNIRGVVTPGTDKVSVNWTSTETSRKFGLLALGGTGVNCNVASFVARTTAGTQTVAHGLGGVPTGAIIISGGNINVPAGSNDAQFASVQLGFASAFRNRTNGIYITEGGGSSYSGQVEHFMNHVHSLGTFTEQVTLESWDATNLTLEFSSGQLAEYFYVLTFNGINCNVGTFNSPPTPTATRSITLGNTPTGFLLSSMHQPATASPVDGAWLSVGGTDGTNQCAASIVADFNDTVARRSNHDAKIVRAINSSATLYEEATASFDGLDADIEFTQCDANEFNYMGFWCAPDTTFDGNFNGTSEYIDISDDASLDITDHLSLSVRARFANANPITFHGLVAKWVAAGSQTSWYLYLNASEKLQLQINDGVGGLAVCETNAVVSVENWHTYGFTFDGGTIKLYVDGVSVAFTNTGGSPSAINSTTADVFIGLRSDGIQYFEGDIDKVRIYEGDSKVLSDANMLSIHNGTDLKIAGQQCKLAMNLIGPQPTPIISDLSGFQNNGTLVS